MSHQKFFKNQLESAKLVLDKCLSDSHFIDKCSHFSDFLIQTYKNKKNLFSCGNGGSHCDALHFAEELTGRYKKSRPALGALALGEGTHTTCVSNDYGFEHIFSRQLQALGKSDDGLVVLSTSGQSPNILKVLTEAKKLEIKSFALLGKDGGAAKDLADDCLIIPADTSERIQEMHIKILHIGIESVERDLFPELYT